MKLKFDCVFYYVSDLDRAITFYQDVLGLKLHSRDVVARFLIDGIMLELVPAHGKKLDGHGNARLCLRVENINQTCMDLRNKGVLCSPVKDEKTGFLSTLLDEDHNEICFWQDVRVEDKEKNAIWV